MSNRFRSRAARPAIAAFAAACLGSALPAFAVDPPVAYVTNPEIYKVVAENDDYRVVRAVWAPGARDAFHSHPITFLSVFMTDCNRRFYFPDGTTNDRMFKKGFVILQDPVTSHSFENIGPADCEIMIVEKKR